MDILITDATVMGEGGRLCIAGWDFENLRMVRPLPDGHHWLPEVVDSLGLAPGVTIRVLPVGGSSRDFPHRTEDLPIVSGSVRVVGNGFHEWTGSAGPGVASTIGAGFAGNVCHNGEYRGVLQGVHVMPGTRCPSLAAINIPQTQIRLFEDSYGALKAEVNDNASNYCVKVTSKRIRDAWNGGGLSAAIATLPARSLLHVRLGLAHPFARPNADDPQKCYMMLNGIL